MATYKFDKEKTAKFKFHPWQGTSTEYLTLNGINASVTSADTICDGVSSLMAISGNTPAFYSATRTGVETVDYAE